MKAIYITFGKNPIDKFLDKTLLTRCESEIFAKNSQYLYFISFDQYCKIIRAILHAHGVTPIPRIFVVSANSEIK